MLRLRLEIENGAILDEDLVADDFEQVVGSDDAVAVRPGVARIDRCKRRHDRAARGVLLDGAAGDRDPRRSLVAEPPELEIVCCQCGQIDILQGQAVAIPEGDHDIAAGLSRRRDDRGKISKDGAVVPHHVVLRPASRGEIRDRV